MYLLSLFIILLISSTATSLSPVRILCSQNRTVVDPPCSTVYFPPFWTENMTAPFYKANQKCSAKILIPNGKYVLFTMKANIGVDSRLKITDSNGKAEL
ncbi:hypothetical protein B9Z55_014447 [Caenorhabditis nigoni]|uniref:CUB-like domain-containing protein n=1 Tax=Caenorhabditis nigoni TaxID=1611254 RepID=A0A2G5U5X3_9PELO|nr:hypothetical protein B9Z55_014447 [Caenorhabditis nigoni]